MAFIVVLMIKPWTIEGYVVQSGSMAPGLRGAHRRIVCEGCGHSFAAGADEPVSPAKWAVCPQCGNASQPLEELAIVAGDRAFVDRLAFAFRSPRRFEAAAFRAPFDACQVLVKRIVGLPGELVEIRGGEIFIDGNPCRKTLDQARALRMPVHDAALAPVRWRPATTNSGWDITSSVWTFDGESTAAIAPAWVVYEHSRRAPVQGDPPLDEPINDLLGYNQIRPVMQTHLVRDVGLECRVRLAGIGRFWLRADDGGTALMCGVEFPSGKIKLSQDGRIVQELQLSANSLAELSMPKGAVIEFLLVDGQAMLAIARKDVLTYAYEPDLESSPLPDPLAIGGQGLTVEVAQMRVFRDIYYGSAERTSSLALHGGRIRLGADEYFVLGDNPEISEDSRSWADEAAVPAELIVGKPFAAVGAPRARTSPWGWIQVPDFRDFHYIR